MLPDEEYKVTAYNTADDLTLNVISVDYEIRNYYPEEVSLEIKEKGEVFSGNIKNNGERNIYPCQIIYFVKDDAGRTIQNTIEYAGCFDDGLVIEPNKVLDFESNNTQGLLLNTNKPVIVRYSDLDFKEIETRFFEQN